MAGTTLRHKRGDTFQYACTLRQKKNGPALDITGWQIRSQLRDLKDQLICEFTITLLDPAAGHYQLSADDTRAWQPGTAAMDIEYRDAEGIIRSTETLNVLILKDETHD
ncbi:MAG: hypothetical protein RLZZ09_6 [Pseudomonadota bacterium]|jgi:hypothetical protein